MPPKPHLVLQNPVDGTVQYQASHRYVEIPQAEDPRNYTRMQTDFRGYRDTLLADRTSRRNNRTIQIQQHIDYIQIHFFAPFDYEKYANHYRTRFGLVSVKFEKFNTVGLFAIENETTFLEFLNQLTAFIAARTHTGENVPYNVNIRFIKEFHLLTNSRIIKFENLYDVVQLSLVDSEEIFRNVIAPIEERLIAYLTAEQYTFEPNPTNHTIQIWNITQDQLNTVLSNFDIVHAANSSLSGVVRPGAFGTEIREFGFTITPPANNAPSIGILDTGVSSLVPLSTILLGTNADYDLIGTGAHIDSHDMNRGHGTGVACFAALGNSLIPDHTGEKIADAWIVSIKIFQTGSPRVSDIKILNAIRSVHEQRGTRIFVLTVSEQDHKKTDQSISPFAYSLDLLAHELDILIIISSGNVDQSYFFDPVNGAAIHDYPNDFLQEHTNIKSPSEGMNNLSVGSCAGNFEDGITDGIAIDGSFPAIYSSKFHYNFHDGILKPRQKNDFLKKPDLIYFGGDWDSLGAWTSTGIKYLSARVGEFFAKNTGTSFSAPLIANVAAKILKLYPSLRMQTVKALIINAATTPKLSTFFDGLPESVTNHTLGHGIPEIKECIQSDDNSATIVLEDEISPDTIISYPIHIPEYLLTKQNARTVLDIKMTLCFSFEPVLNNQVTYCPIHIGYGIFKNLPLESQEPAVDDQGEPVLDTEGNQKINQTGLNKNLTENIKIKSGQSWSEDYYFKIKLLSNTQKTEWVFNKDNIEENENTFKVAINCLRHKLLTPGQREKYNTPHRFSLVINLKERPLAGVLTGNLYDELTAINELTAIADLEADLEV